MSTVSGPQRSCSFLLITMSALTRPFMVLPRTFVCVILCGGVSLQSAPNKDPGHGWAEGAKSQGEAKNPRVPNNELVIPQGKSPLRISSAKLSLEGALGRGGG